ncbi:MAG: chemotaxis protein CheW [Rhodothermaceae bacterium]
MSLDANIKILLVEDAAVMRKMERKVLGSLGFNNIIDAEDGDDAIEKLKSDKDINLVISDWNMPNKTGLELLVWMRATEEFKSLPFIMATGRGEKKEVTEAEEAGVNAFISKPFNAAELKDKIDEAFGQKEVEEETERPIAQMSESGKVIINIAHIQITDHLVLGVLKHLINTGEFTPKHFELQTHRMSSWNPVANALDKGTVEGACVLAPIAMDLYHHGAPLKLVLFAHRNGSIFVRNKKGSFSDPHRNFFKDKSFYIPHTLSIHNMLGHMFFNGIGLQPGVAGQDGTDVAFEVVPPVKMPEFLGDNPEACGYLVAEPLGTKAIANGLAELQFLSSEIWENHPCCVVCLQDDFIDNHTEAAYEFVDLLVKAGKFIDQKPGAAAEVGVEFLDPDKSLGLKVPLLRNVLTEPLGIKTNNLYPSIEDLDRMQRYMNNEMNVGGLIDVEKFVDIRFAKSACGDQAGKTNSLLHESYEKINELLIRKEVGDEDGTSKALLNMEGKYLMFSLAEQEFGIDILKIREIIKIAPITNMPQSPHYVKGIIDLRGIVIPIIDVRLRFGMPEVEPTKKSCIIVLEIDYRGTTVQMGIIVDSVSEVKNIAATDIEEPPEISTSVDSKYIMAMVKGKEEIKILLDIDLVLSDKELSAVSQIA